MEIDTKKWIVKAVMCLSVASCWAADGLEMQASPNISEHALATAQAQLGNAKTNAYLSMWCTRNSGHALGTRGLELALQDPSNFKDFNFEDFEGPDAKAGKRLTVQTVPGKVYRLSQYGLYRDDSFVFGFADLTNMKQGAVERIVGDIAKGAKTIKVTVVDTRQPNQQWVANFEVSPSLVKIGNLMCK